MQRINEIYKKESEGKVIISNYIGKIEKEKLEEILSEVEKKSEIFSKSIKRKLFLISIELIQNLYNYSLIEKINGIDTDYCIVQVTKENENITILTGNFVNKHQKDKIINKINNINQKNPEEIQEYYRTILNNSKRTEKGGAGLGLIDIKRKAEQALHYKTIKFDKNLYFFIFSVSLENKI